MRALSRTRRTSRKLQGSISAIVAAGVVRDLLQDLHLLAPAHLLV